MKKKLIRLNCKGPASNTPCFEVDSGGSVSLVHQSGDPASVNRIKASFHGFEVELLPSKGLALGRVFREGKPVFWNPPIGICDPDTLDLYSDEIAINGTPSPGFTFLRTYCGGIEFYGLRNWGMPAEDKHTKFQYPIHGETSNIPVDYCDLEIDENEISLSASYIYREIPSSPTGTWYLEGPELFKVERRVRIMGRDKHQLEIIDRITNISDAPLLPDWGYHITFQPTDGSQILLPSSSAKNRSGEDVPGDFETWTPAKDNKVRTETGIIHKGLKTHKTDFGDLAYGLLMHPDHSGLMISFPLSPYFQTWICSGGAGSTEFTKVSDGKPLFSKNWDGIGIEIGSSALDHDGNTDPVVPDQAALNPGSSIEIPLLIEFPDINEIGHLAEEIQKNNINRKLGN